MTIVHVLFISMLSTRIPVLPPFTSEPHLPPEASWRKVGEVFDIPRWSQALNKDVIEWGDLKIPSQDVKEEVGCWSVWATTNIQEGLPRGIHVSRYTSLGLYLSY